VSLRHLQGSCTSVSGCIGQRELTATIYECILARGSVCVSGIIALLSALLFLVPLLRCVAVIVSTLILLVVLLRLLGFVLRLSVTVL
jgi:hypothetical protein